MFLLKSVPFQVTFGSFSGGFRHGIFRLKRSVLFTSAGRHTFRGPAELREHMARIGAQQELQLAEDLRSLCPVCLKNCTQKFL